MKKAVLYPFSELQMPLLKYFNDFSTDFQLVSTVAPVGTGLCGKDISLSDNRINQEIVVKEDLKEELSKADAIFIPWYDEERGKLINIVDTIEMAISMGKDIISNTYLSRAKTTSIKKKCKTNNVKFIDGHLEDNKWLRQMFAGIHRIPVPVIFVGGFMTDSNNFEVALSLAKHFKEDGYKVAATGIRPEYNLMGFHYISLLADLVAGRLSGKDMRTIIIWLNHYFYSLVRKENPDVLIVEIPGGMIDMPEFPNESGVFAYILSQILKPDYTIGCSLYSEASEKDYEKLTNEINQRFGYPVDCIHISNKEISISSSEQKHKMEFIYQPIEKVISRTPILGQKHSIYCLLDETQVSQMYHEMLKSLAKEAV